MEITWAKGTKHCHEHYSGFDDTGQQYGVLYVYALHGNVV